MKNKEDRGLFAAILFAELRLVLKTKNWLSYVERTSHDCFSLLEFRGHSSKLQTKFYTSECSFLIRSLIFRTSAL